MRISVSLSLVLVLLAVSASTGAEDPAAALRLIRPKPAQMAKEFKVATPEKTQLRLSDFKGKVIFLNFWATWCEPCKEEMPAMERLYQKYRDRGLLVLAISVDTEGAAVVTPFVKKYKFTFRIGLDPRMSVTSLYGVWAVPSTFIIDREGKRILFATGPREWDGAASHALFDSLLR
ncbi:MAG TPA: TlpA disulfide reductase family protein [Methylomirabilota bacterium]|nr:TlpA disulfide reductase family protein [Methylomirabilota bacterium]